MMGRAGKRAWLAALGLAGAGALGARWLLQRSLPQIEGDLTLTGLSASVEVRRDAWGIPHLYAETENDLFFAQGFVHAQDRLWQMELRRRIAFGRLSEVVGGATLEVDRFMRRLGLGRVSEQEAAQLDPDERRALEAYAAGVNAFLTAPGARLPLEFTLLRHRPEPWRPADSLAWGRLLALSLSGAWEAQLLRARVIAAVGIERAAALEPLRPSGHPVVITSPDDVARADTSTLERLREVEQFLGMAGSNAWAVSGARTQSGAPLLANDPHLAPEAPAVWYENHLTAPSLTVTGASLAGLPGVIIGHNGHIAWGATAGMVVVQDAVIERINPENPRQYQSEGGWETGELLEEVIKVRGRRDPIREPVLLTRHGPVVTPMLRHEQRPIAVQSTLLTPGHQIGAGLRLNRARTWDEFRAALADWPFPSINFVYADTAGNIGYQLAGRAPRRRAGHGMIPMPGWRGDALWDGFVPPGDLPHALNPADGIVVSSNNQITEENHPLHLDGEWDTGARARRIAEELAARTPVTPADFREMHQDVVSLPARETVAALRAMGLRPMDPATRDALRWLLGWDGTMSAESIAASIYQAFRLRLLRNLMAPYLGNLVDDYFGGEVHALTYAGVYVLRSSTFFLDRLRGRETEWLAGTGSDTWDDLIVRTLRQTVEHLAAAYGADPHGWRWGRLHAVQFNHALGRNGGPLGALFNLGAHPIGGDGDTIHQTALNARAPYATRAWMPLYRQIIDLGDVRRSVAMHIPGQSGHRGSPRYADLMDAWKRGEYHPMLWDRADVVAQTAHLLTLRPMTGVPFARPAAPAPASATE